MSADRELFCHCFRIPLDEAADDPAGTVETIRRRVAAEGCDCARLNPSGRCCLTETDRLDAADGSRGLGAAAAGLGAGTVALAASACCVPVLSSLLVTLLGVGGAVWAAGLEPWAPWILLGSGIALVGAAWLVYRPRRAAAGVCALGRPLLPRVLLWLGAAVWLVAFGLNLARLVA